MSETRADGKIIFGIILIVLGVLFLMDTYYVLDFRYIIRNYWPSILILIGIVKLIQVKQFNHTGALVLIVLGIIFQMNELDYIWRWQLRRYWPVLLILLGAWLIFKHGQRQNSKQTKE